MSQKGTYPKADLHIRQSGLRVSELAKLADVSEKSILRVRRAEPVLDTTIQRIINALNAAHFNHRNGKSPLVFEDEFVPEKKKS